MAVVINFVAEEDGFVCYYGQLRADENTLVGNYEYVFQKVVEGTHIDTPREHLDFFTTYQDMYDAFYELTTVPSEAYLNGDEI